MGGDHLEAMRGRGLRESSRRETVLLNTSCGQETRFSIEYMLSCTCMRVAVVVPCVCVCSL